MLLILLIRPSLHSPGHSQHLSAAEERQEGAWREDIREKWLWIWTPGPLPCPAIFLSVPETGLWGKNKSGGTLG